MKRNIAEGIIIKCGGVKVVAAWCGLHLSSVYDWITRGLVPSKWQAHILKNAKANKIDLTEKDFF